ncbi:polysaccharide biosynthesis/export family protein [Desulforhopalus sp. IMCC35007]|uniref:polysaccharide biosynthesis/export family protein n=1 Tax=Desulforhopalus sp. IMCC35007 TaxID=2569543 RepID=UPI0010ADA946|nr:polysaccharide biosynthesis/export family protein [Desulforhopalus sp. IMCC35007]TKB12073.1 polysaccharide export protein [Desulforhopalus sp. IMCC35007]
MIRLLLVVQFLFLTLNTSFVFSAQSSADVTVSPEQKKSALAKILGSKTLQSQSNDEYIIGHGDILTVSIFEEGDMSVSAPITAGRDDQATDAPRSAGVGTPVMMDGRISLKNIGDVEVVGLTLTELADYLKTLYSVIYDDPIITTTLAQSNSLRYTVMGEVTAPGIFFLDYPMSLVQVVARAGGFTEWAGRKITVVRENIKQENKSVFKGNTLVFDYDDFISGKSLNKNVLVQASDIIIVD